MDGMIGSSKFRDTHIPYLGDKLVLGQHLGPSTASFGLGYDSQDIETERPVGT